MDEYTSEICMGGYNTIAMHNTCEVSGSSPLCLSHTVYYCGTKFCFGKSFETGFHFCIFKTLAESRPFDT